LKFSWQSLHLILPVVAIAWLAAPPQASVDITTTDTLNFTITSGFPTTPTPTGSFTFDDTTNTLTSYTTSWDGFSFDFTSQLAAFDLASLQAPGTFQVATPIFSSGADIALFRLTVNATTVEVDVPVPALTTTAAAQGTFASSPALSVPEPSALALLGPALAGLFLFKFRANRRGPPTRPA